MSGLAFTKMHGAGNDYVFVDGFETQLPAAPGELAIRISNRNFGIGSDGLVFMEPSQTPEADVRMRMWNADGSEGSMCGNAARCVALWMELQNKVAGGCVIETATRLVKANTIQLDRTRQFGQYRVDLGTPKFDSAADNKLEVLADIRLPGLKMNDLPFVSVSMGNPHAVFFVDKLTDQLVLQAGSVIEKHPRFPDGTNVEWVKVVGPNELQVRVWERGSGETLACGSGACAVAVAAIQLGKCDRDREVVVRLPGGNLKVEWTASGSALLSGPASVSFVGKF